MMNVLLSVEGLKKYFTTGGGLFSRRTRALKAVDGVTFTIRKGETLGLVGESGCGKTTIGRLVVRLEEPTEGTIVFDGTDITELKFAEIRPIRKKIQMIFQDPMSSLNPRMNVERIVAHPIRIHGLGHNEEIHRKALELLNSVGLDAEFAAAYPHQLSGGQRQRVAIARALSVNPELVVADEVVSALDVSVQAQILNLLKDLQNEYRLSYLFISHNLAVVKYMSNTVAVMYLGRIMEMASPNDLYVNPLHPYTMALLSAIPKEHPAMEQKVITLKGDPPSPIDLPVGCKFHPRCPFAEAVCRTDEPLLVDLGEGRAVSCHFANSLPDALSHNSVQGPD
jgi:oligopeptide transport system ATP-binding protein